MGDASSEKDGSVGKANSIEKRKNSTVSTVSGKRSNGSLYEDSQEEDLSCSEQWRRYPKHVMFIVGMEFCERFSYYGMRSVLLLYLRNYLGFGDDTATSVYHAFTVLAYFTPVLGAIVADSYWGKYKTIIILSIVYIFGHIVKVIGSIPFIPSQTAHVVLSMLGLVFIAFGTGGIKPCVSSFGGDQFTPDQAVVRKQFFSLFYFAINAGSLISTFVTPILRADVDCYPNQTDEKFDECYALAFGVPAALMVIALILFVLGSKWYIRHPPEGSIFWKFCHCIGSGIKHYFKTKRGERNKEHWLDNAKSTPKMIRDTKYVLRVLVLFIPLPFFWALFDQQGSRWTLQAIELDGHLGSIHLKPDQIETLNPIFIVTLIPLFEVTLYPFLRYFKIPFPPLRRMTVGLFLAGAAFIAAAVLQLKIDEIKTPIPSDSQYAVRVINQASCNVTVSINDMEEFEVARDAVSETEFFGYRKEVEEITFKYTTCNEATLADGQVKMNATRETVHEFLIRGSNGTLVTENQMTTKKTEDGGGKFSFLNAFTDTNLTLEIPGGKPDKVSVAAGIKSEDIEVDIGPRQYEVFDQNGDYLFTGSLEVLVGAVYTEVLKEGNQSNTILDMNANSISVAWIFPQFFIITVGEVFLSITGLEFSYTQAPPSMKSVLTSFWLLTVSFGNIIVLIIAEAKAIDSQAGEFFLFAGLIGVAGIIFIILAYLYIPVDENEFEEELREEYERRHMAMKAHNKIHPDDNKEVWHSESSNYNNVAFEPDDQDWYKDETKL